MAVALLESVWVLKIRDPSKWFVSVRFQPKTAKTGVPYFEMCLCSGDPLKWWFSLCFPIKTLPNRGTMDTKQTDPNGGSQTIWRMSHVDFQEVSSGRLNQLEHTANVERDAFLPLLGATPSLFARIILFRKRPNLHGKRLALEKSSGRKEWGGNPYTRGYEVWSWRPLRLGAKCYQTVPE